MPTRITDHDGAALALLPKQFPADVNSPSNWVRLARAIVGFATASENGFAITAVSVGDKTFTMDGDKRQLFSPGGRFTVTNSTGNDGDYTIVSSVYSTSGNTTVLVVNETIADATIDGNCFPLESQTMQELEDLFFVIYIARALGVANGNQLDGIGEIVGLSRTGSDDEAYRNMLRVKIGANAGGGAPEEIIDAAVALNGVLTVQLFEAFPAFWELVITGTILTEAQRNLLKSLAGAGIGRSIVAVASSDPFVMGGDMDAGGNPASMDDPDGSGFAESFEISTASNAGAYTEIQMLGAIAASVFNIGEMVRLHSSDQTVGTYPANVLIEDEYEITGKPADDTIRVEPQLADPNDLLAPNLGYVLADGGELSEAF